MAKLRNREDLPKVKINKSNFRKALRIFKFMGPDKGRFVLGIIFLLLTSATALLFPKLMGMLIDGAKTSVDHIDRIALFLLALFTAQAFFSYGRIYLFAQVTEFTLLRLRKALYSHLIQLPMSFFAVRRVGEINSRMAADLAHLQDTFTFTLAEFLRQGIIIIGGIVLISITSGKLTLFMLALIPAIVLVAFFFGRYVRSISKQVQERVADSNTIIEETLQGIANVKSFANELFEIARYGKSVNAISVLSLKNARARGFFASFIIFCLFGSIVAVVWYAMRLVSDGVLSEGEMFSFVLYTVFVGASIGGIADQYGQLQRAIGATERVLDILDEDAEQLNLNLQSNQEELQIKGAVEFDSVHFSYPARKDIKVIAGMSFDVVPGECVALVGSSGAGKSTIASLLLRFYDPDSGRILIDGKDAREYNLGALRNQMAIVPQDVLLFGGSIKENIAYGDPSANMDQIIDAAGKANARQFIEGFPEGYDTLVRERGITLSGGQRQRIAIARAVLKNPSVLILDEATSALDSKSERLVQLALDELMKNRTSFVVAHRLSTVRNADKILVIDKGKIVESGTHEQLITNKDGFYFSLSKLQFNLESEKSFLDL